MRDCGYARCSCIDAMLLTLVDQMIIEFGGLSHLARSLIVSRDSVHFHQYLNVRLTSDHLGS